MARKIALIIGNSEYDDASLARLITPSEDVNDLAALLKSPDIGGFDEVLALVNESAAALRRSIAKLFAQKSPDDLLLLYFSGHGVLDDQGQLYLAVKDTERDLLSGTAIPASFITSEMDHSRSKRQVLILDCCHSGAFARGAKGVGTSVGTGRAFEGSGYGRVVLTATDSTQYAWEGDKLVGQAAQSVFTYFMIQGLQTGEADQDQDSRVTLDELYDYVYAQVVAKTPKQTPGKWSYKQQGDIVIAKNPRPPDRPPEPMTREQPPVLAATPLRPYWTFGRLAVLTLLLAGLFGPWIRGCTPAAVSGQPPPAPTTVSGLEVMEILLLAPVSYGSSISDLEKIVLFLLPILLLILFGAIVLRLAVRRARSNAIVRQAEQIAAHATLLELIAARLAYSRGEGQTLEPLWGFWMTLLGLVLMEINLWGEQMAARRRHPPPREQTVNHSK